MRLARVRGNVVSSVKSPGLGCHKLLLVEDLVPDPPDDDTLDRAGTAAYIAVDLAGAGEGEVVIVTVGSAARIDHGTAEVPTDAAVVGIVDTVNFAGQTTYVKD